MAGPVSKRSKSCGAVSNGTAIKGSHSAESPRFCKKEILLFWPNIVGYMRLGIFFAACGTLLIQDCSTVFLSCYCISALLDVFDGYLARMFDQISLFGSWLDVVIDNLQRAFLWASISNWGSFVSAIEWLTFCATRSYGSEWKNASSNQNQPWLARKVTKNGYKTPLGYFVLVSVHVLPIWIFAWQNDILNLERTIWASVAACLVLGRLLAFFVECWLVLCHASGLLDLS